MGKAANSNSSMRLRARREEDSLEPVAKVASGSKEAHLWV